MSYADPFSDPHYQHDYYDGAVNPREHEPVTSYGEEDSVDEEFLEKDYHQVGITGQEYPPEPVSATSFGFPAPQLPADTSVGGREATARLYRTQTSAEAWSKRQKVNRTRAKTIKVKLSKGNFVHEYPVPTPVKHANLMGGHIGKDNEFTHMRYTAVTCDPDDFTREAGWSLRPQKYGRDIELLVAIVLVARTLHGVMLNLKEICKAHWSEFKKMAEKGAPETGAGAAWKKIAVVLVFDGIEPADKATLDLLATLGVYQDGVMKKEVDGKETQAHVFEYTTMLSVTPKLELISPQENDADNLVPVQMTFVLKQKNAKKINSHRWLFNAICPHLEPEVCILLDAGTKPGPRSLYYLWEAFFHNPNLGGACGEIHAMLSGGKKLLNPLVAAQNFEYKMSNILDKPLESSFGYVSVLPGAFSAYRTRAIRGRPLQQYFHGDHSLAAKLGDKGVQGMGIFKKNMFLAEDRILCFELVAKAKDKWVLGYVKPAKGETDVPESAAELIGQRRRWLNGSFAAGVYALAHFPRMYKTWHNPIRLLFLHVQAIYTTVGLIMSWFSLANWYVTFAAIIDLVHQFWRDPYAAGGFQDNRNTTDPFKSPGGTSAEKIAWVTMECWSGTVLDNTAHFNNPDSVPDKYDWLGQLNYALKLVYLALVSLQIILALGNRPKGEKKAYLISLCIFASFAIYLLTMTLFLTVKAFCPIHVQLDEAEASGTSQASVFMSTSYGPIFAGLAGTFGIYIFSSILYMDPWHLLHSMIPYLFIAVSFTNILNVYAFCNLHDVSWGTKGSDKAESLPSVSSTTTAKDDGGRVVEDIRRDQSELDTDFKETVARAMQPLTSVEAVEKPTADDLDKTFRTRFIAIWLLGNAGIIIGIMQSTIDFRTKYFQALLWITFGLSLVRFFGFAWYLTGAGIFRVARLCARRR
ncbi:Chitin synthase 2 [Puccinia graminis f. sp. tritici]|uniref:Chitin synthase n=1 Tax=Puccinia graminis f. sp. tritici TaxID=56615 RepID=A0A5B0PE19_PUCGR|nr:Chitin synthase 2 [Puccinia graminis f. sp. tritici]